MEGSSLKHLNAPWRSDYVTGASSAEGCVLCGIGRETGRDRENYVLLRERGFYVVLNRFPYINGHLMIVPLRHAPDLSSLEGEEVATLAGLLVKCEEALLRGMDCMGMNGGWNLGSCAGAGIEGHLHFHMLPRWSGDTNFLTTVGETRVLSASLDDSFRRLLPHFDSRGGEE
jgi:ATP adenylyltransferase